MFCKSCGKQLPDESQFCPYCMTKFGEEKVSEPSAPAVKAKSKKLPVIIIAAVLCAAIVITGIIAIPKLSKKNIDADASSSGAVVQGKDGSKGAKAPKKAKTPAEDTALGLMNVKIQDSPDLNDIQKLLLQYFDKDYFRAPYNSLQRYPQIYKNAQINTLCYVEKIIESNSEEFTALVEYETQKVGGEEYEDTGKYDYAVIKGKQTETRIMEGDTLTLYGKYIDVNTYTVDGKSYTVPTILVNRFTYCFSYDTVAPMYSTEEMRSLARYIFGEDVKIRYTQNSDVESDYDYENYQGQFYTAELDNQSNANFTKYMLLAGWGGEIIDLKSDYPITRNLTFSADFEHFYLEVFDYSMKVFTLECYDRDLKKIWSREFDQTTSSVMDYTSSFIYLVANGSLYIINAETGENALEPKYVGAKTEIRKLEDGILLVNYKCSDAVMKTDLTGNVLWTANLSYDMGDPTYGSDPPIVQIIGGNYVIQYVAEMNGYPNGTYTAVITPDGAVEFDAEAF